jgi:hypothetical protein
MKKHAPDYQRHCNNRNPQALSKAEKDKIQQLCCTNNFALFAIKTQEDYAQAVVQINESRQRMIIDDAIHKC